MKTRVRTSMKWQGHDNSRVETLLRKVPVRPARTRKRRGAPMATTIRKKVCRDHNVEKKKKKTKCRRGISSRTPWTIISILANRCCSHVLWPHFTPERTRWNSLAMRSKIVAVTGGFFSFEGQAHKISKLDSWLPGTRSNYCLLCRSWPIHALSANNEGRSTKKVAGPATV